MGTAIIAASPSRRWNSARPSRDQTGLAPPFSPEDDCQIAESLEIDFVRSRIERLIRYLSAVW